MAEKQKKYFPILVIALLAFPFPNLFVFCFNLFDYFRKATVLAYMNTSRFRFYKTTAKVFL